MQLGCFGFITTFDLTEAACASCLDCKICQDTSYKKLAKFDCATTHQRRLLKKHERWARHLGNEVITVTHARENFQTVKNEHRIKGLSKNAMVVARVLLSNDVNILRIATEKTHDYALYLPKFLPHLLDAVAKNSIIVRELISRLMDCLNFSYATARSYVYGFLSTLQHWKLISRIERGHYEIIL